MPDDAPKAATYDEFGMFHENAEEAGLDWNGPPVVERVATALDDGRTMQALRWGDAPPELVFLHGGGQNAHTWDTVALALDRPLLAIDLPGHGHSDDVAADAELSPRAFARDTAPVIAEHAPAAEAVIGMSLGGLTALALASTEADLVRRLLFVDITPGVNGDKASDIIAFLAGPESFSSFEEILERTIAFNPTRSESSLRRGVLHNAVKREDGTWVWRHQRTTRPGALSEGASRLDPESLWDDLARLSIPMHLAVGANSPVVSDDDVDRFTRTQPGARVVKVADAGHSIQGDQPVELARIIAAFVSDGVGQVP